MWWGMVNVLWYLRLNGIVSNISIGNGSRNLGYVLKKRYSQLFIFHLPKSILTWTKDTLDVKELSSWKTDGSFLHIQCSLVKNVSYLLLFCSVGIGLVSEYWWKYIIVVARSCNKRWPMTNEVVDLVKAMAQCWTSAPTLSNREHPNHFFQCDGTISFKPYFFVSYVLWHCHTICGIAWSCWNVL